MTENLQFIVTGLATGAVYALVGLGIALVYQLTGIINFAQGDFVMVGALSFAVLTEGGTPLLPAALVAIGGTCALGMLVNLVAIQPARRPTIELLIILTIGASITIQGVTLVLVGTDPHFVDPFTKGPSFEPVEGVVVLRQYLWVVVAVAVAVAAVWYFLARTTLGKAMRACAMNRQAARICAISPARMSLLAFALAATLGAVGGVVLAPLQNPDPGMGLPLGLKGFTAAVIGGLDSPAGAVAGGLFLGVVESLAVGHLPSGYKSAVAYGLLFVVLIARPQGLLRRLAVARV